MRTTVYLTVFGTISVFFSTTLFAIDLQFTKVSNRGGVVDIRNAGDGSARLFLVEQGGLVRVLKDGAELANPFLDIENLVSAGGERGLLSLAFTPDYKSSGYFYVWYTDQVGSTVLSRFSVSGNPDVADAGSEEIILTVVQPFANHNGGRLQFGPDGFLYLGLGDGGGGGDPQGNAQNMNTLLGKLIRIDVDPAHGTYTVPEDNPFLGAGNIEDEIWASGLRNPWRISFDPQTGDLYIADVGQSDQEEVNFQPANSTGGENYGWDEMEGSFCFQANCNITGLVLPVVEYNHEQGCSVTGGEIYRGNAYPDLEGMYLYGDFCSGTIWGLTRNGDNWQTQELADTDFGITTFGLGEDGSIYISTQGDGIYLVSDGPVVAEVVFKINTAMSDAWFFPATSGQGFFIIVWEDSKLIFLSWFTYDTERPPEDVSAILGEPGHRWLTAVGPYEGDTALLDVFLSSGMIFDSAEPPVDTVQYEGATIEIVWTDCKKGLVKYNIPTLGLMGEIPIERIVEDKVAACEAVQVQ